VESFDRSGGSQAAPVRRHRSRLARLLPFIFFAIIALVILRDQFPVVDGWLQRLMAPERWQAMEHCQRAALAAAKDPGFARVIDRGRVHETAAGYYIEGIRVGEPGDRGGEIPFLFQCYTDRDGKVVKSVRQ
jgi:hypothetical protein